MSRIGDGHHLFVGGRWAPGAGEERTIRSPASGRVLGSYRDGTAEDVDRAVRIAREAQTHWAGRSPFERVDIIRSAAVEVRRRLSAFARLLTEENGKPLQTEASVEIEWAANQLERAADWALRVEGSLLPSSSPAKRILVRYEPKGVIGVITPWNHPVMIPCEYLGPALATGNAAVWVPSPSVVACAVELADCFDTAGLPAGLLSLIPGPGGLVGDALAAHPGVAVLGLTGSTATGAVVARRAAGKPLVLELGGNGPTVVLPDADIQHAAEGIAAGAFANAGQSCSATELVIAHSSIRARLVEAVVAIARKVVLGDPLDPTTSMGPLHTEAVVQQVESHIAAAVDGGGRIVTGGRRMPNAPTPNFFEPTVVDHVDPVAVIATEETFGPVVPVVDFNADAEALAMARRSGYGLIAAVYGRDLGRAMRIAEQIPAGIVNVNDTSDYWELHVPFGGAAGTRSGTGRIGGRWIGEAFTETRTLIVDLGAEWTTAP